MNDQKQPRSRAPWPFAAVFVSILFAAVPLGSSGQSPPDELRGAAQDAETIANDLDKLVLRMTRLAEKLRDTRPYYADKLVQGVQMVEKSLLREDIELLRALLTQGARGLSLDKARKIEERLIELLNFLEDRRDMRDIEKKLKELKNAIEQLKSIQEEQRKTLDETRDFNIKREQAVGEIKEQLNKLLERQLDLHTDTKEDPMAKLAEETAAVMKELDRLAAEQKDLLDRSSKASALESPDFKNLEDAISKLSELVKKQEDAHATVRDANRRRDSIEELAGRLHKLSEEQKELAKATAEAAGKPEGAWVENLARRQAAAKKEAEVISDRLQNLGGHGDDDPIAQAAEETKQAAEDMHDALEAFDEQSLTTAAKEQEQAAARLAEAKEALAKAAELDKQTRTTENARLQQLQAQLARNAQEAGDSLAKLAESATMADAAQAFKDATKETQTAAGRMDEATRALSEDRPHDAQQRQEGALSSLRDALTRLERLRNQMAQKNQPTLDKLANAQEKLADDTAELTEKLQSLASSSAKKDPAASSALSRAASNVRQADKKMDDARRKLFDAQPKGAANDQQNALDRLKTAKDELSKLHNKLAKALEEKQNLKTLKDKQNKLKEDTKQLADRLQNEAEKQQQAGSEQIARAMRNAGESSSRAVGQMQNAAHQMQQGNREAAQDAQKRAMEDLKKALDEFEKLRKRDLTQEEKYILERLARQQEEIEKKTRELQEQIEKMKEQKRAAQSLDSAANKMRSASSNMSGSPPNPQQAQQDEEEALKDLEDAMDDLAQAEQQYESLMQELILSHIEDELRKILTEQKKIGEATVNADFEAQKHNRKLSREMRIALNKLADRQGKLADECLKLVKQLKEEGSAVFSWVLETIVDDMRMSQELLGEKYHRTDDYTQGIQRDIERKLRELMDALKRERQNKRKRQDPGSPGGGSGKQPLVPPIAELKMLRQMQLNLKRKTEEFVNRNIRKEGESGELDPVQQMILRRLAAEQENLADKTRDFAEALQKMQ